MLSTRFGYLRPADLALARAAATFLALIGEEFFLGFGVSQTGLFATFFLCNQDSDSLFFR
jgi:hypothetical protein